MPKKEKILIVGNGPWANKVQGILIEQEYLVQRSSAREFSRGLNQGQTYQSDVIWLCTRPSLQLEIIKNLKNLVGKIILEKPILMEAGDEQIVKNASINHSNIFLSNPWANSDIWESAVKLLADFDLKEIIITRDAPHSHPHIPAHLDWLSHDLLLLSDLRRLFGLDLELVSKAEPEFLGTNKLLLSDIKVELSFTISEKRKSVWFFLSKIGEFIELDFLNGNMKTNIIGINGHTKVQELHFETSNSLVKMLSKIFNESNNPFLFEQISDLVLLLRTQPPK